MYCGETAERIEMPFGTEVALVEGKSALEGGRDPHGKGQTEGAKYPHAHRTALAVFDTLTQL